MDRKKVLVTGFGPYEVYKENASWQGVQRINEDNLGAGISLFTREIAVRYSEVDRLIPELYNTFQPHFAIHVGISDKLPAVFYLESKANKPGIIEYTQDEGMGTPLADACYEDFPDDYMTTSLDVHSICKQFNQFYCGTDLEAVPSEDAGRFVCEYIYYKSLCLGPALFVHVPPTKYSYNEIAEGLETIIKLCVDQLSYYEYALR